jgi:hypothetical protein
MSPPDRIIAVYGQFSEGPFSANNGYMKTGQQTAYPTNAFAIRKQKQPGSKNKSDLHQTSGIILSP